MDPFKSEIRNSPRRATIKIFLDDVSFDSKIKDYLEEYFNEIEFIEIRETLDRNSSNENLTVFLNANADVQVTKEAIDSSLRSYFEQNLEKR